MLLAERAAAVRPGFALTAENEELAARLCRRLDGIPLAIELAATRLRAFGLDEIVTGLDDQYRLPGRRQPSLGTRHATWLEAVEWSWDLCSAEEQRVWARASVFAGGLDPAAAAAVCGDAQLAADDVADTVAGLVDKSVLTMYEQDGIARYGLLETLRQYGRAKLDAAGESEATRRRHRDYYLRLTEEAAARFFGPDQVALAARARVEHPNVRAALEFCLTVPGEARVGMHLAGILWFHWYVGGLLSEARYWLDGLLALDPDPSPERLLALRVGGYMSFLQGDAPAAARLNQQAWALAEIADDQRELAYLRMQVGMDTLVSGGTEISVAGLAMLDDSMRRFAELGELTCQVAMAANMLTGMYALQGDPDRAVPIAEKALVTCEVQGERWMRGYLLTTLAIAYGLKGEWAAGVELLKDALRLLRNFHDLVGTASSLEMLAWLTPPDSQAVRAVTLAGAAEPLWRATGQRYMGYSAWSQMTDKTQMQARQILGDDAYRAAFQAGTQLSLDDAMAYALQETPPEAPPPPVSVDTSVDTTLTPRERQVAVLVAEGLTNREIATKLVIAQRTAESHVEHILTKLHFTSRAQIARWRADQAD